MALVKPPWAKARFKPISTPFQAATTAPPAFLRCSASLNVLWFHPRLPLGPKPFKTTICRIEDGLLFPQKHYLRVLLNGDGVKAF